jgi:methyl-accepting chemotaxis protein
VNPLLLPPRLLFRALDDLHALAQTAAQLPAVEERMNARLDELIGLGERIEGVIGNGLELAEQIRATGERVAELGEGVDERAVAIIEMGKRLEVQGEAMLEQGRHVERTGREVAENAKGLADALPMLQRAVAMAEPLEGAVERLGRVVDRLPGGRTRAGS